MYILIVEDDRALADTLGELMREQHYTFDIVDNGEDGLAYAESDLYDMVLLDIMLPKMDGFEVVKQLRKKKVRTPVILLTARDDISDKVRGLDCGADDYLTKPFSKEELFARIRSNSRRQGEMVIDEITVGDLRLDLSSSELTCGKKTIRLGFKEFTLFKLFMQNPMQVFSKTELLSKIWGYLSDAEENHVEVYVSFLRKKLAYLGTSVNIETIRKLGYRLSPTSRKEEEAV